MKPIYEILIRGDYSGVIRGGHVRYFVGPADATPAEPIPMADGSLIFDGILPSDLQNTAAYATANEALARELISVNAALSEAQNTIAALEAEIAALTAKPAIDWAALGQSWGKTKAVQRLGFSQVDRALLAVNPSVEILQAAIEQIELEPDEAEEVAAVFSEVI